MPEPSSGRSLSSAVIVDNHRRKHVACAQILSNGEHIFSRIFLTSSILDQKSLLS